jgi:hypothetical protein
MKSELEYTYLIVFVIFLLVKKFVALVVEVKFPTYNDLDGASIFWKVLVKIRSLMDLMTLLFTSYFLYNYKFTPPVRLIFQILLLRSLLYFLIDDQFIWLFINRTHKTREVVHFLNTFGDSISDFIITCIIVYALTKIFAPK